MKSHKFHYRKVLSGLAVLPVSLFAQDKQPNVIIMYIDDMGIGDVSCFGRLLYAYSQHRPSGSARAILYAVLLCRSC